MLDLIYRFLLWSSLSFSLHVLAAHATDNGGRHLAAALSTPPNNEYALVVFGISLLLFVFALVMKDIHHLIKSITILGRISAIAAATIGRVSSDLLLSLYAMGSFIFGWMVYEGYSQYGELGLYDSRIQILGFGLHQFAGLIAGLGLATAIVRVDEEHPFVQAWYETRLIWRVLAYATSVVALYFTFWSEANSLWIPWQ